MYSIQEREESDGRTSRTPSESSEKDARERAHRDSSKYPIVRIKSLLTGVGAMPLLSSIISLLEYILDRVNYALRI